MVLSMFQFRDVFVSSNDLLVLFLFDAKLNRKNRTINNESTEILPKAYRPSFVGVFAVISMLFSVFISYPCFINGAQLNLSVLFFVPFNLSLDSNGTSIVNLCQVNK